MSLLVPEVSQSNLSLEAMKESKPLVKVGMIFISMLDLGSKPDLNTRLISGYFNDHANQFD